MLYIREKSSGVAMVDGTEYLRIQESPMKQAADDIPEELYDKRAMETAAPKAADIQPFLKGKGHPVTEKKEKAGKPIENGETYYRFTIAFLDTIWYTI